MDGFAEGQNRITHDQELDVSERPGPTWRFQLYLYVQLIYEPLNRVRVHPS